MHVIGIDPAPTKETAVFDGQSFTFWSAHEVAEGVASLAAAHDDLLLAWDAPLGLDPGPSHFYSRQVDKVAKRVIAGWVAEGRVEAKAIGVAHAAGCPHNLLTQAALGLPVGGPKAPWRLCGVGDPAPRAGRWLVEVHPAVALGAWWPGPGPMPRYKAGGKSSASRVREARRGVVSWLQREHAFPAGEPASFTDDHIDAWLAWRLASLLLEGGAAAWGPEGGGYYLMPALMAWPG